LVAAMKVAGEYRLPGFERMDASHQAGIMSFRSLIDNVRKWQGPDSWPV
jgi:hypothetical protein